MKTEIHHIDGKKIKEFIDLPYGAFAKIARKVDPNWGLFADGGASPKPYEVHVTEYISETREHVFTVIAWDEDDAEAVARALMPARLDESWNEWEIESVEEKEAA